MNGLKSRGTGKVDLSSPVSSHVGQQISPSDTASRKGHRKRGIIGTGLVFLTGIVLVGLFFYFDRHNEISRLILSVGGWGIVLSIFLMAVFCIVPVPSEFLLVLDMKVYGAWWGSLYCFIGSIIGSLGVFLFARYVAGKFVHSLVPEARMEQVTRWVARRGVIGLLIIHAIPIPFIVVNYAAGIIRSITLWDFFWTTAIGGIPYFLGAALVFLGLSKRYVVWIAVGAVAIVSIWLIGYLYNRRSGGAGLK